MITPEDIDAMPEFTDAQMLKLYRQALVDLADTGKATGHNGRQLTRADEEFVWRMVQRLEVRVQSSTEDSTIALVTFGQPR